MPLRPPSRIPRRFNRPVTRATQRLLQRRHRTPFQTQKAPRWRRLTRVLGRNVVSWRRTIAWWSLLTFLCLLLLLGGMVIFSPLGRIQEVRVTRTDPRLDIEQTLSLLSPLFGRPLVTVSSREVRALLEGKIFDLQAVSISKHYPSQLLVRIELDPLAARVRVLSPEEAAQGSGSGGTLGTLTDRGVYEPAVAGRETGGLPLIDVVDWGVRPQPGALLFTPDFLKQMNEAVATLESQFGQKVQRRAAYVRAQEFHLLVNGVSLWFDLHSALEQQLLKYRTFLRTVGLVNAKQYIDLRLADRVVYR